MTESRAHLVFLRRGSLLIVKRPDADWRQLQDDYEDYMASLGPWTTDEIVDFFSVDYGDDDGRWPFTKQRIADFMQATDETVLECQ